MSDGKVAHSHGGHRQRQRERFRANGLSGFAAHEVLELILGYAIPRQDVNPLAHRLIDYFGSLHNVLDASVEELMRVDGVGEYTAVLLALFAQVERQHAASRRAPRQILRTRADVEDYCIQLFKGCKVEHFYAIYLNGQMEVLATVLVAKGSISEVHSYPRIVADHALRHNAHAVVVCHNHPGGSLVPSTADLGSTIRMQAVLEELEVRLIDHILVACDEAVSVMAEGIFPQLSNDVIAQNRAANSAGEVTLSHMLRSTGDAAGKENNQ